MTWVNLAMAFNRDAYPTILDSVRGTEGLRVVITEPDASRMLELVKRAVLYTDMIVVYSGRPSLQSFEPLLEGVRKGGIVCDGVPEWFHDLLILRPLLLSGHGVCIQKHYFDPNPESVEPRWILTDLKYGGDRTVASAGANTEINPYSVYADLVRPASLDCVYLGRAYEDWRRQLITSFKSAQELTFASILQLNLPYLSHVPLEVLVELRHDEPEPFQRARTFLWQAVRECLKFDTNGATTEEFARYLESAYLEPLRRAAKDGAGEAIAKKYVRRCGPVISTLSLAFNALIGNPIGMLLDGLWLTQQGTSEFLESGTKGLRRDRNDLYLFDKLEQLGT